MAPAGTHTPVTTRQGVLDDEAYRRLLALRTGLRRFLNWSESQARQSGLTPAQHQLLLAVKGHPDRAGPTIGEIAGHLLLRHHSAVELVQRAEAAGLVGRRTSEIDRRQVHLELTPRGSDALERLTALHLEELERLAGDFQRVWAGIEAGSPPAAKASSRP